VPHSVPGAYRIYNGCFEHFSSIFDSDLAKTAAPAKEMEVLCTEVSAKQHMSVVQDDYRGARSA
jgi:hypothetical protein